MAELFFIATIIFVAYVVLDVLGKNDKKTISETPPLETTPEETADAKPTPPPLIQPIAKTTKSKSSSTKASAPAATTKSTDSLKNPKTGEIAKMPTNYAFAKRWIKDALVEEGLLEKVYKNNELDTEAQAKIQSALLELKTMPKYQ